jgi:hypothetical protein
VSHLIPADLKKPTYVDDGTKLVKLTDETLIPRTELLWFLSNEGKSLVWINYIQAVGNETPSESPNKEAQEVKKYRGQWSHD